MIRRIRIYKYLRACELRVADCDGLVVGNEVDLVQDDLIRERDLPLSFVDLKHGISVV